MVELGDLADSGRTNLNGINRAVITSQPKLVGRYRQLLRGEADTLEEFVDEARRPKPVQAGQHEVLRPINVGKRSRRQ